MESSINLNRDFNSISPSAKWILLMKGHTTVPYARQAAEIIQGQEKFVPDFDNKDTAFWGRTFHFESRYCSIDNLLADSPVHNILELSSGFSFRGLDLVQRRSAHYIDTDLPDMIVKKKELMKAMNIHQTPAKGSLKLLPLNVLDEKAFGEVVSRFPAGEVAIINEGLLVYLNTQEKEKLCNIIRNTLKERGGYWITADIYLKLRPRNINLGVEEKMETFFEEQQVEENRFDSFEAAEEFFRKMGFVVDKEAAVDYATLSSLPYLMKNVRPEELQNMRKMEKVHTTWRLRLADE